MARPACETWLALFIIFSLPCFAQQSPIDAAKKAFARGDIPAALEGLRRFRASGPDQPLLLESLALSVQYSLAAGDVYKASYVLRLLQEAGPGSAEAFEAGLSVADWYYDRRSWRAALEYFTRAVDGFRESAGGPRNGLDLALLRCAELSLYHAEDTSSARLYFRRIIPFNLPVSQSPLYREMSVRLFWSTISPTVLGLDDGNISSLTVDGDDMPA